MATIQTALVAAILVTANVGFAVTTQPFNRIVVLIDGSGSYAERQMDAIQKTQRLLGSIASTELRRWEAGDEVVIIALDAIPEVIWRGHTRQLADADLAQWETRFRARRDYSACTDVTTAFRLAAQELERAPEPTARYLAAFTDLLHEPPTSSSRTCRPVTRVGPPADFPWDALLNTSVSVFWVPIDQKLAWQRAVADRGTELQIKIYSDSESASVEALAPAKARRVITERDRAKGRGRLRGLVGTMGTWLMWSLGAACLLGALLGVTAHVVRRRPHRPSTSARVRN